MVKQHQKSLAFITQVQKQLIFCQSCFIYTLYNNLFFLYCCHFLFLFLIGVDNFKLVVIFPLHSKILQCPFLTFFCNDHFIQIQKEKEKKFVMTAPRIYCLNFHTLHCTAMLTIVIVGYITPQCLFILSPEAYTFCPPISFSPSYNLPPPPLGNTNIILFCEVFFFCR